MLELVATIPSMPLGPAVLVMLDIVSRLNGLVAGAARGSSRGMQLSFIREKVPRFHTARPLGGSRQRQGYAGQMLNAVLPRICCWVCSERGSARNSSRFFLTSGTPGPGQSVPKRVL